MHNLSSRKLFSLAIKSFIAMTLLSVSLTSCGGDDEDDNRTEKPMPPGNNDDDGGNNGGGDNGGGSGNKPYFGKKSEEAVKLLTYLHDNAGKKMLTSTCACVDWNISEALWVNKHTGKFPAINNFDYIHDVFSTTGGWIDYSNISVVTDWVKNRGVVSAMWHWNRPDNNGTGYSYTPGTKSNETSFKPSAIFDPSSDGYKQMINDIDRIARWMKPLANRRIPIIWRPLHEAQGNWNETEGGTSWHNAWFWWGIDGPEACVKLWQVMYDRMVNYHGLTNLIWVFTTGDSMKWYPGDEYVDIVACDLYNQDLEGCKKWYKFIQQKFPGKLIAMAECGNIPKISEQWKAGLYWSYFMPWYDYDVSKNVNSTAFNGTSHQNCDISFWKDALNCDFIVTRDEMPDFLN